MSNIIQTENGETYDSDNVKNMQKCDVCGKLADTTGEDGFMDGRLPSLHSEKRNGGYADICRDCLITGVPEKELEDLIGDKTEQKTVELE